MNIETVTQKSDLLSFFIKIIAITALAFISTACGPKEPEVQSKTAVDAAPEVHMTADDFYHPELIKSEFTNEVDEKRFRPIGDTLSEISPRQRIIYFVGKLRRVPTQAQIKVLWYNDNIKDPVLVTDVFGSDTFSFISKFTPPGRRFMSGKYTVRVIVNGKEAGSNHFIIKGVDPFKAGVKISHVKIAKKLNKRGVAIKPSKLFKFAAALNATFKASNVMNPVDITVRWIRGESVFNESVIHLDGNGRFSANIASPGGIPKGVYKIEFEKDNAILKTVKFAIGKASIGPSIDYVALGETIAKNGMPKKKSTKFKKGIPAIYCGLRFLDLEPDSKISIDWVMIEGGTESVYYTVETPVPEGGSGSMNTKWDPGEIFAGKYKAVIYINDELAVEKEFKVK